jgi:hypothetical protein
MAIADWSHGAKLAATEMRRHFSSLPAMCMLRYGRFHRPGSTGGQCGFG